MIWVASGDRGGCDTRLRDENVAVLLSAHQMNLMEELCERIFLIHRGKRVLYGTLSEIKDSTDEHVVHFRFSGDAELLAGLAGLADLRTDGDQAWGRLPAAVDPAPFLRSLPEELGLQEVSVRRPPLHDIFVSTVQGGEDAR